MRKSNAQKIFELLKENVDSTFKDSLINIGYLRKMNYPVGELMEHVLVVNINRMKVPQVSADHIGLKTKNKYDSKTDIVVKLKKRDVPFSVKTGQKSPLKIRNRISTSILNCLDEENCLDKKEILNQLKNDLSTKLYILHLTKRDKIFFLDLKKINVNSFASIKRTTNTITLRNRKKETIVFFDLLDSSIYVGNKGLKVVDSIELGVDNSDEKLEKGESLLIDSIITNACLCDIPLLRKIDETIKEKVFGK